MDTANGFANDGAGEFTLTDTPGVEGTRGGEGVGPAGSGPIPKIDSSSAEILTKGAELVPEAEWCAAMGLTRELVREYRLANLTEGEHFEKKAGRIGLTAAGVGFLEDAFDLPAKKEGPAELEVVELVAAKKCRCLNKRILLCEFEGRPVRVRVRSSEKFVPGMKVPARRIPGGAEDLWEFAGKRLPRGKGRY